MNDNTRKKIDKNWRYLGWFLYGFTHPFKGLRIEISNNKKKERALQKCKDLAKEYETKLADGLLTKDEDDRLTKEFLEAVDEFRRLYDMI